MPAHLAEDSYRKELPMPKKMTRGAQWAADVRRNYPLNESEELLVDMIHAQRDRIDAGELTAGELRLTENVMLRAIGQLALPFADEGVPVHRPTHTAIHAAAAARARWQKERDR
jgi:hypothetical protein